MADVINPIHREIYNETIGQGFGTLTDEELTRGSTNPIVITDHVRTGFGSQEQLFRPYNPDKTKFTQDRALATKVMNRESKFQHHQNLENSGVSPFLRAITGTYQEHSLLAPLAAAYYASHVYNKSSKDFGANASFTEKAGIFGAHAIGGLPQFMNNYAMAAGVNTILQTVVGNVHSYTDFAHRATTPIADIASYHLSRKLSIEALRSKTIRNWAAKGLDVVAEKYQNQNLTSAFWSHKAEHFNEVSQTLKGVEGNWIKGNLENVLGKETLNTVRPFMTEALDLPLTAFSHIVVGKVLRKVGEWVDKKRGNTPHQNLENSGEQNRYHLKKMARTYRAHSTVDVIRTIISGEKIIAKEMEAVTGPSGANFKWLKKTLDNTTSSGKSLGKHVKKIYNNIFSKYNITEKEFKRSLVNKTTGRLLRKRGVNAQEVLAELKNSPLKSSKIHIANRVFRHEVTDSRHISSLMGASQYSEQVAFEGTLPAQIKTHHTNSIKGSRGNILITDGITDKQHLESMYETAQITGTNNVSLHLSDADLDMNSLDKYLAKKIRGH